MTVVDDRARIFGRYNLIDLAFVILLVGLIPLAYGAYVLFRVPVPKLISISPATRQFENEFRVTVTGENLRPYMRVSLNDMQGRSFFFKSATTAEVVFGDVPPGEYDVVLYDNVQERNRLPKAFKLTAAALPPAQVDVAGFLTSLTPADAKQIVAGVRFGSSFTVIKAGPPAPDLARVVAGDKPVEIPIQPTMRVPVLLRVNCDVVSGGNGYGACVAGQVLAPSVYLKLPTATGAVPFLIVEVRPAIEPTMFDVRVAINLNDPALPVIREGDNDVGYSQLEFAGGARVTSPPDAKRIISLRVPAYPTLSGWLYTGQPVRVGAPLLIVTQRYQFTGIIVSEPPPLPK